VLSVCLDHKHGSLLMLVCFGGWMVALGCGAGWNEGAKEALKVVLKSRYQVLWSVDGLDDRFVCLLDPSGVRACGKIVV